jgi:hypothetical protein
VRQASALGFVKTGKDFGLPQLFWSKHAALIISTNNRETCVPQNAIDFTGVR